MEMLVVLLLLALSDKNTELKETLNSVLKFYRENRELLALLTNNSSALSAPEKKDSPEAGGDSLHILEEFLKNRSF